MKNLLTLAAIASLTLGASTSFVAAQDSNNNTEEAQGSRRFWEANLPGGQYMVALDRISSISKHKYLLNGTLMITEVTIDTSGNSLARFYSIAPLGEDSKANIARNTVNRAKELIDQTGKRTGVDATSLVVKEHPTTTHAKTVEYRLANEDEINRLYASAKRAWMRGRGSKFTIK